MSLHVIDSFQGQYRWLSNFWPARVEVDGLVFASVEHAYAASKSVLPTFRRQVQNCATAGDAKRLGRGVMLRPGWDAMRVPVMRDLLRQKFQDEELRCKLLATGEAVLIEGNTWGDTFWGVCRGRGDNNLGKLLMGLRSGLSCA